MALRLLIVDDHPIVLSGLRLLLAGDGRFALCGEATTAADARTQAERLQPDLIVTDLVMGGADGVGLVVDLLALAPAAAILVYSSHDELIWARHALKAGARGYVSKVEPLEMVAIALQQIGDGGIHVSEAVQRILSADAQGSRIVPHDMASLSVRELQILTLMGSGHSLQSLSLELQLSIKTIGTYRERLKIKLGFDTIRMLEYFAATLARTAP